MTSGSNSFYVNSSWRLSEFGSLFQRLTAPKEKGVFLKFWRRVGIKKRLGE